jgi:CDGSH-type Zn-finger protein
MTKPEVTGSNRKKATRKVKVTRNGPYLVSGAVPLTQQAIRIDSEGQCHGYEEEKEYPVQENYALCRCGRSRTKPFCDGTHTTSGFHGAETAGREPYLEGAELIEGPALRLTDKQSLCASAGFCERAGGIWELTKRSDNSQARKTAIEEACDCPSGRLVVWDNGGNAIEPKLEPSLAIVEGPAQDEHGPIWVRGNIEVEGADGTAYEPRNRVTLCRCGKSGNKPFCDGSHRPSH